MSRYGGAVLVDLGREEDRCTARSLQIGSVQDGRHMAIDLLIGGAVGQIEAAFAEVLPLLR